MSFRFPLPDVKREADALAASWGTRVEVIGSIPAMRVPKIGETDPVGVSEIIGPPPGPTLNVITRTIGGGSATRHARRSPGLSSTASLIDWLGSLCSGPKRHRAWISNTGLVTRI